MFYLKIFFTIFSGFLLFFSDVQAYNVKTEPVIIDERGKPGDFFKEIITISNTANYKLNLYGSVYNLEKIKGEQEFDGPAQSDLSVSLANWIELHRGVFQLLPGESKQVEFSIKVNPRAQPGIYHAGVAFYEGSDRVGAENRKAGSAVLINLEVIEGLAKNLSLKKFAADKVFFTSFPISLTYQIENSNNKPVLLDGEISIFDRRGEAIGSVAINEANTSYVWSGPERSSGLASVYEFGKGFGRYKAVLHARSLNGQFSAQDITFFWVIPYQFIILILAFAALITITAIYLFRHAYEYEEVKT